MTSPPALVLLALCLDPPVPAPSATPSDAVEETAPVEALRYPLGARPVPDFLAPGDPFTLTDLRYDLADQDGTQHSFAARARFKDWGYFGAEAEGERRGLTLMTHRLSAAVFSESGTWDFSGGYRAHRFVLSADALLRGPGDRTWQLAPTLSVLVTSGLELSGRLLADTAKPGKEQRLVTDSGLGVHWQRGARLEVVGEVERSYSLIATGDENRTDRAALSAVAQIGPLELDGHGSVEDVEGRFPRRDYDLSVQARLPLTRRLVLEGGSENRLEKDVGELFHEYRGALTWYGRRFTLPRSGRVAERAVALARHAWETGEYELAVFDDDAIRAQRERLSLAGWREGYRDDMAALYRAQVAERPLPLFGIEARQQADALTGESVRVASAFVGVPWPPTLPWRATERSVPFLQVGYDHEWHTTAPTIDYRSGADTLSLTASLSREMDFVVRWSRLQPTALDVIRGVGVHQRFEASCVYARGR
ncbi:MAG TPA: hypothetical protein VMT70_05985 [Vicinamibacteria bacterium]|nr:hypothetical protein [Vicinamibacteria bacterium]